MDDASHVHTVYLPVGGYTNLVIDGDMFCSAANAQFVVAARSNNAAASQSRVSNANWRADH